jgi:hypothetical protein
VVVRRNLGTFVDLGKCLAPVTCCYDMMHLVKYDPLDMALKFLSSEAESLQ